MNINPNKDHLVMDEGKVLARELIPGLDHVANCLNALDTEGMTANEVRSAIYSECLQPGCRIALSAAPSEEVAALIAAADKLSFAAQSSGGTAGRDEGLVAAIDAYASARAAISSMGGLASE